MDLANTVIKCLPREVQGKLRSGVAIPSLQQCVEELILNSIDAGATCVGVRIDMEAFKVQVVDNGAGMAAEDVERVGNRYYTSKCSSLEDLDSLGCYGFRGEALASIVSLATLVEISSRSRSSVKTHVKVFKNGKGSEVFEAETPRPSAGTTVVICNFFHNMPVRRKRMDAVLEAERIRHRVEAVSLMHPSVSLTLKNDCTGAMMVQLPKAKNTHHRFVQIHGLGRAQKLGEIGHTHGQFKVTGYIGREGHYNGCLQFLYVNERLLMKTRIHKLLNFLLRRLSSSNQKNDSPDGQFHNRSPKHKRSQEQHGVYIINIKCPLSEYDVCLEPAKTLIEFKDWDGILLCIEQAVKAFLSRENLVAVLSQDDLDFVSPEFFGTDITDQEGNNSGKEGQATSSVSILDCSIGVKLASESVHRKRKNDCVSDDGACQGSGQVECKEDEAEKMPANDLEKIQSEGCAYKECRDEPECDLAQLEPMSDNNITEEEEPKFSKAGEGSHILCLAGSVRQIESKKLQLSKDGETRLNNTTSNRNVTSPVRTTQPIQPDLKSIEQILPDCQDAEGCKEALISNRKISLSDPFIHHSLETQDLSQINKSQCKVLMDAGHDSSCQKQDFSPIIPSKIPRIVSCQRLSLCQESGNLDKFRRVFGKSNGMKLPSLQTSLQNNSRLPQTNSITMNPQSFFVCQKDQRDGDVTQTQKKETEKSLRSPPTLSVFTRLKPVSAQNKRKKTLATKLCHLKHHRSEASKALLRLSGTTSLDNTRPNSGNDVQDSNNNKDPGDTALNPEPVSGCNTNPQLADEEEDATSGDWLHHYNTTMGKMVYVNRVTGLSKYNDPSTEETQVRCTSDITNMAVSVISETGKLLDINIDLTVTGHSGHR